MEEILKLKVICLKKYQDIVHLYICKMGSFQFREIDIEKESLGNLLEHNLGSPITSSRNMEVQSKIKKIVNSMGYSQNLSNYTENELADDQFLNKGELVAGDSIDEILGNMEAKITFLENQYYKIEEEYEQVEKKHLFNEKRMQIDQLYEKLKRLYKMTYLIQYFINSQASVLHSDSVIYFELWVISSLISAIKEGLHSLTNGKCIIKEEKGRPGENVPIITKPPPKMFESFSNMTLALGYPRKDEINPTLLVSFTFPLLFGLMFADLGQGALLVLIGLFFLLQKRKVNLSEVGEIHGYFLKASGGILLCGLSSMFFGIIYGEFFGPSGLIHPIKIFHIGPFKFGGYDPIHEPITLLRFTVLVGMVFISGSMLLNVVNNFKQQKFLHAFSTLCWLWFLIGGFTMWIYWGGISQITKWFNEGAGMFLILVVLPLFLLFLITTIINGLIDGLSHTLEASIEALGHTLSFSRIAALFLTHSALNAMFLNLSGVEDGHFPLISIPIILLGTFFSLAIEGLLIMIHVLRLHWIEILPKFYSGEGIPFKTFKIEPIS